ncbi:hypothetical protein ACFC1L_39980 [Streptomyces sp. NPDC056210]|uniref:hypothetical protein n=1 Tax=Streptomyces sp. NPDC056210 TaxID=3345746 RepID=UPI0035DCD6AB
MAVSLAKTPQSIAYGEFHAKVGRGLRSNNLLALAVKFDDQFARAEVKAYNDRKAGA